MWDILFLVCTWQDVKRRLFRSSFQRYQYVGYEPVWERPSHMQDLPREWRRTCSMSIPLSDLKWWKIERRFIKGAACHLLASGLVKALEGLSDLQNIFPGVFPTSRARVQSHLLSEKQSSTLSLSLTSPSLNLASRSKRAAPERKVNWERTKSRKIASLSPLFTEADLSLEREDKKLSPIESSGSLKRTGRCRCRIAALFVACRLSAKCE